MSPTRKKFPPRIPSNRVLSKTIRVDSDVLRHLEENAQPWEVNPGHTLRRLLGIDERKDSNEGASAVGGV